MNEVSSVHVWITGRRDYPHAHVKLPTSLVEDLPRLLAAARELNPSIDVHVLVWGIWRLGSNAVRRNHRKRIPLVQADFGAECY